MIKALISSADAMSIQRLRHELIANNLANANTPGFQRLVSRVVEGTQADAEPGAQPAASRLRLESLNQSGGGPLSATGNPLDLALVGEGYFLIDTPQGPRLSRDGSFSLNAEGQLIHSTGNAVLAGGSSVTLSDQPSFLSDGSILDGDKLVGRLSLVRPVGASQLIREGGNLLKPQGDYEEVPAEEIKVLSGHIEGSSVEPVTEMVDMIRAFQAYEVATKAVQAADDILRIAVQRVGVLRA